MVLGALSIFDNPLKFALEFLLNLLCVLERLFSKETCLNASSKFYFELCIKKCNSTDLLEVILYWVSSCASIQNWK